MSRGIFFRGNLKEGNYTLIKTTDGWVLNGEDIIYAGFDEERPQGEWIPCSERLPDEQTWVLVQADDMYYNMNGNNGVVKGMRNGRYWHTFTANGCENIQYPLAWMPLPKPWKGTDNE